MLIAKLICIPVLLTLFVSTLAVSWNRQPWCPKYSGIIFRDTAHHKSRLEHTVDKFRATLGGIDNGNEPGRKSGQRSINWDADVVPFNMPGDFFKNTVTRGAEFFAFKGVFAVSNPPATDPSGISDNRFSSFHPAFAHIFKTFSPKRLFTPVKNNKVTTKFSVPQSKRGIKAHVSGFGAIFTGVVLKKKTIMNFYDKNNCLIISLPIDPKRRGLSFGGIFVTHKNHKKVKAAIASVKITLGTGIISQPVRGKDFVVLDDLIYGEPLPIWH